MHWLETTKAYHEYEFLQKRSVIKMTIRGTRIAPAGEVRHEVRVSDGKHIKYEFGQRPEDEVYGASEFTEDVGHNLNLIANGGGYYSQNYLDSRMNSSAGNADMRSHGGRCRDMAYGSIFGESSTINNMYHSFNDRNPIQATGLVRQNMSQNASFGQRGFGRGQQQEEYDDYNQFQQAQVQPPRSLSDSLTGRIKELANSSPQLFKPSAAVSAPRKTTEAQIPGKQFIRQRANATVERDVISEIRQRRQQVTQKFEPQASSNKKIVKKINFEEI